MKVFLAGGTGAIGRPLLRHLIDRGHDVTAVTRSREKADDIRPLGIRTVVGNAADPDAMSDLFKQVRPQAVVSELTSLPRELNPRKLTEYYAANDAIRLNGTKSLLAAARAAGVERFVSQSAAFWYRPTPGAVKMEKDPFDTEAPEPVGTAAETMARVEGMVRSVPGIAGINLRYASLYGPGTWYAPDGDIGKRFAKRQFPIIGAGDAVMSFVHVNDAALATVIAMERGKPGDYNIADDEPAVAREWMPHFAEAIGAKPPLNVPVWIARFVVPAGLLHMTLNARAASNERAKRDLGWTPKFGSWRRGFREGLG